MSKIQTVKYQLLTDPELIRENGNSYLWTKTGQNLIPCKAGRFKGMNDSMESIGITDGYQCLEDDFNLTLSGSYSAAHAELFNFVLDYCQQTFLDWKYPGQ